MRLALGWTGVLIAGVTALYSYRLEYEKSKPVIWIGLIVYVFLGTRPHVSHYLLHPRYMALSLSQALYAYFIEGDTIFVGKRKTFDKRVSVAVACVVSSFVLTVLF